MKIKSPVLLFSLVLPALLAACSILPGEAPAAATAHVPPNALAGQAQATPVLSTATVMMGRNPVAQVTQAPAPVEIPAPAGTGIPTQSNANGQAQPGCDQVAAGQPIDVTVQDGSRFSPGQGFSKTWRLVNAGKCPWTRDYTVVWFSGENLGMQGAQNLPVEIAPGQSFDLTVDMIAPQTPGNYQSNWKLKNPDGALFGLGPNGNAPFWVQIEVVAENTATPGQETSFEPTLPVFLSKLSNLVYNDALDLDSGDINIEGENDITYRMGAQGKPEITPQNNARLSLFGTLAPAEDDCQAADLQSTTLTLENASDGVYLCYRTSRALPGFMHVQQSTPEDGLISVDFITWTVP